MTLSLHLKNALCENQIQQHAVNHESERLIRVAKNLMRNFDAETNEVGHNVYTTSLFLKRKIKSKHLDELVNKTQHGHLKR